VSYRPGRLVLLGHPVAHSLSPLFQNAALRSARIPIVYEAIDVPADGLRTTLDALRAVDAAGNVTIPHKEAVAALCDDLTAVARRAGAVNTFWTQDGRLSGDNTDVGGFQAAVSELRADPPRVVALFGAGGGAAAALTAVEAWRGARARVYSRTRRRTQSLCSRFDGIATAADSGSEAVRGADLVVNATPVGLIDDAMPIDPSVLDTGTVVLDLVYRPGGTAWVRSARARGMIASDGTTMLLEQGALAFERWFGLDADRRAMREALFTASGSG
jgi:shikimate dehydrogenase